MPKVRMYQTDWCPFCRRAEALLREKGVVELELIAVELDAKGRAELQSKTGRRTVPQIYIGETHVRLRRPVRARARGQARPPARDGMIPGAPAPDRTTFKECP